MEPNTPRSLSDFNFEKLVDTIVRLAALFLLIGWCFSILRPFVLILIWAAVIAVAIYPLYTFFIRILGKRTTLAAVVLTILMLSVLMIPSWLLAESLFEEVSYLRELNHQGKLVIPPPGDRAQHWPAFTKPILDFWTLASENLQSAAMLYAGQLKAAGAWFLAAVAGIGTGILQFVVSIIIAGVFLAYSKSVASAVVRVFSRIAGGNGEHFAETTVAKLYHFDSDRDGLLRKMGSS